MSLLNFGSCLGALLKSPKLPKCPALLKQIQGNFLTSPTPSQKKKKIALPIPTLSARHDVHKLAKKKENKHSKPTRYHDIRDSFHSMLVSCFILFRANPYMSQVSLKTLNKAIFENILLKSCGKRNSWTFIFMVDMVYFLNMIITIHFPNISTFSVDLFHILFLFCQIYPVNYNFNSAFCNQATCSAAADKFTILLCTIAETISWDSLLWRFLL